jgi:hypothetical protein
MSMARTPVIIGLAAVASAAILGGSAVAVSEIGHQPPAVVKAVPAPTKTIIKHKTKIVHEAAPAPAQAVPAAPVAPDPAGSLRDTGNGVYAGPSTSNAFAQNVAADWDGTPGTQTVYSPVTGQSYPMTYQVQPDGTVIATGGNGAYVQF